MSENARSANTTFADRAKLAARNAAGGGSMRQIDPWIESELDRVDPARCRKRSHLPWVAPGGSRKEGRVHIFWQRRIREGDDGPGTPRCSLGSGGLRFVPPTPAGASKSAAEKPKRQKHQKQKNDPQYIAAARELRDRYLEEVNAGRLLPMANGKYDVGRQIMLTGGTPVPPEGAEKIRLLDAA